MFFMNKNTLKTAKEGDINFYFACLIWICNGICRKHIFVIAKLSLTSVRILSLLYLRLQRSSQIIQFVLSSNKNIFEKNLRSKS
jgi:hypothetical protein